MSNSLSRTILALLAAPLLLTPATTRAQGAQRVYLVVADSIPMAVPAASMALADALTRRGWTVLANYEVGGDQAKCTFSAHVVVASKPERTAALLTRGARAAYDIPVRLGVFEDEKGVHVGMVNPLSIERTIVAESGLEASGRLLIEEVSSLVVEATRGHRVNRQYGQSRDRGLIGKTMGVMAGGPFLGRLQTITSVDATPAEFTRLADDIWQRLRQPPHGTWGLRGIYRMTFAEQGLIIIGVSGTAMETNAFQIVGAGDDNARSSFKCPGLAYAPAFPLELVIVREDGRVRVEMIDAMYRMKMYFEDAGRMKFARNMRMPGSIADELKEIVLRH